MTTLSPLPGFDWSRVTWLAPDQPLIAPDAETEVCSYCGGTISDDVVPLRMWNAAGWGAVFCDHCMTAWWGFILLDDDEPELRGFGVRSCRVCGCTDDHACPGGCCWVEPDLCSACAAQQPADIVPQPRSPWSLK
jgi:hypothetical protein